MSSKTDFSLGKANLEMISCEDKSGGETILDLLLSEEF